MTVVVLEAPAKVNLGLEVIGKRPDGFHEIRSILAATTLTDTLSFTRSSTGTSVSFLGTDDVIDPVDNLIARAIDAFNRAASTEIYLRADVIKRIPAAAGLGGASADAAITLKAMQRLSDRALHRAELVELAGQLGSDVPFFLGSAVALASGRGTDLVPLPGVVSHLIIVMPDISVASKTARLYGALEADDLTDGSSVDGIAGSIRENALLPNSFPNAFDTAFRRLDPRMDEFVSEMQKAGVGAGTLSGAGPARFLHYRSKPDRDRDVDLLRSQVSDGVRIISCDLATEWP